VAVPQDVPKHTEELFSDSCHHFIWRVWTWKVWCGVAL